MNAPAIMELSIVKDGAIMIEIPKTTISAKLYDSVTNALVADFTGENALTFPVCMDQMTDYSWNSLMSDMVIRILNNKVGYGIDMPPNQ